MQRQSVSSSDLKSVGYDPTSSVLEIEFVKGGIYQYQGVPANVHRGLMSASSHGKFFHSNIKDKYPTQKVG